MRWRLILSVRCILSASNCVNKIKIPSAQTSGACRNEYLLFFFTTQEVCSLLFVAGRNTVCTAHWNIFFQGVRWYSISCIFSFDIFIFILFNSFYFYLFFQYIFSAYFTIIYAFSYFTISKFQSIHYNNFHFVISNSHYKSNIVSSAVLVDSSPLETV